MHAVEPAEILSFYSAGWTGLRALAARGIGARRFGPDADATWTAFRGELTDGDRLDLLLRDAAVAHPAAFAPRSIFQLAGLAPDEPFGPDWPGPAPADAAALLRATSPAAADPLAALRAAADSWSLRPSKVSLAATLASIRPASRLVAVGPRALLDLAAHFHGRQDLDLADQVTLLTDHPGERQLFGLAAALLGSTRPARSLPTSATAADAKAAGLTRLDLVVAGDDAPAREAADALARALTA